jgi:hypothetical protein
MFKVFKKILNDSEKNYLNNNIILNKNFPYYLNSNQTHGDNRLNFCHVLKSNITNEITSEYFFEIEKILIRLCQKINIKFNKVIRAAINLTYPFEPSLGVIHVDHDFYYKQMIIYLNDSVGGGTCIYENNKLIKKVNSEKFKVLFFEKQPHAIEHPKKGIRIIIVMTFI